MNERAEKERSWKTVVLLGNALCLCHTGIHGVAISSQFVRSVWGSVRARARRGCLVFRQRWQGVWRRTNASLSNNDLESNNRGR